MWPPWYTCFHVIIIILRQGTCHFRRLNLCLSCFGIQPLKSETRDLQDIWLTTALKENLNLRSKYYNGIRSFRPMVISPPVTSPQPKVILPHNRSHFTPYKSHFAPYRSYFAPCKKLVKFVVNFSFSTGLRYYNG